MGEACRLESPRENGAEICGSAIRRQFRAVGIGALLCALSGCSGSPSQNIFGSYFPSWMLCAIAGLFASILVRQVLAGTNVGRSVPVPILVYLALSMAIGFAVWFIWIG